MNWNNPDELLAVVDDHDEEIGTETRQRIHDLNLLHRAVHVLVFDTAGNLLIQKRSATKDLYPLHWECVGGHLGPGEAYVSAAKREVREELGIDVRNLEFLCKIPASAITGFEFIEVYRAIATSNAGPDPAEVADVHSVSVDGLRFEVTTGQRLFSPVFLNTLQAVGIISPG